MHEPVVFAITPRVIHWNEDRSMNTLRVSDGFISASGAWPEHALPGVFFPHFGFVQHTSHPAGLSKRWVIRTYRKARGTFELVIISVAPTAELALREVKIKNTCMLIPRDAFDEFQAACAEVVVNLFHYKYHGELYES